VNPEDFNLANRKILTQLQNVIVKTNSWNYEYLALKSQKESLEKECQKLRDENKRLSQNLRLVKQELNSKVITDQNEDNSKKYYKIAENKDKLAEKPDELKEYIRELIEDIDRTIALLKEY
jgi:seryl-tRNA synthetase